MKFYFLGQFFKAFFHRFCSCERVLVPVDDCGGATIRSGGSGAPHSNLKIWNNLTPIQVQEITQLQDRKLQQNYFATFIRKV